MSASFSADVVSAQFPCGAAWLANALLELQVALPELWGYDTAREWQPMAPNRSRYVADELPWRQTLAALRLGREFQWQPGQCLRFSHAFPWQLASADRCVVMVRDPRDALHSEWRRQQRNQGLADSVDLPAFAASSFCGSAISQADCLWLHLASWLSVANAQPDQVLLLRFEDCKFDPAASLRRVIGFLDIEACDAAIHSAVAASDVRHLQQIERALPAAANSRIFNRAGIAYEWQTTWQTHWHVSLGPHWGALLAPLDYAPRQHVGTPVALADTEALLAATGVNAKPMESSWMQWLQWWRAEASVQR